MGAGDVPMACMAARAANMLWCSRRTAQLGGPLLSCAAAQSSAAARVAWRPSRGAFRATCWMDPVELRSLGGSRSIAFRLPPRRALRPRASHVLQQSGHDGRRTEISDAPVLAGGHKMLRRENTLQEVVKMMEDPERAEAARA